VAALRPLWHRSRLNLPRTCYFLFLSASMRRLVREHTMKGKWIRHDRQPGLRDSPGQPFRSLVACAGLCFAGAASGADAPPAPVELRVAADDDGLDDFGREQGWLMGRLRDTLRRGDTLAVNWRHDLLPHDKRRGRRGWKVRYDASFGAWSVDAWGDALLFFRRDAPASGGAERAVRAYNASLGVSRVLATRGAATMRGNLRVQKRLGKRVEVAARHTISRRNTTFVEAGLSCEWPQAPGRRIDAAMVYRRGVGWGSRPDPPGNARTSRFHLFAAEARTTRPLCAQCGIAYEGALRGQYSPQRLFPVEEMNYGGRNGVRGLGQGRALTVGNGVFWRNTFVLPALPGMTARPYWGVDLGLAGPLRGVKVRGAHVPGGKLAGVALGLRHAADRGRLTLDAYVAWPVLQPARLDARGPVLSMRIEFLALR
jgi:hemolysin activation/secretion protein